MNSPSEVQPSPWAIRPFEADMADEFNWTASDSAGMEQWRALREAWPNDSQTFTESFETPVVTATSWSWWWQGEEALVSVCLVLGFLAISSMAWIRTWQLRRLRIPQSNLGIWRALRALNDSAAGIPANEAIVQAAYLEVRNRLLPESAAAAEWEGLDFSSREMECADFILQGLGPQEIAEMMHCTPRHVYNIRSSIRKKLDLPSEENLMKILLLRKQGHRRN